MSDSLQLGDLVEREKFLSTVKGTVRKKRTKPVEIKSHHVARVVTAEALTGSVLRSWGPFMGSESLTGFVDPFMGAESLIGVLDRKLAAVTVKSGSSP